jgi:hypothetical protein
MAGLAKPAAFETLCRRAKKIKWVVFAKAPFGGPEQVLKYLARYTHRVAIWYHGPMRLCRGLLRGIVEQPPHLLRVETCRAAGCRGGAEDSANTVRALVTFKHAGTQGGEDAGSDVVA